jgi:hypothetical protein
MLLHADVIYTNFGITPDPLYQNEYGETVSAGGTDLGTSFSFVVSSFTYQVTAIDFAAYLVNGTNAVIATLYADNGGVPGTELYTTGEIDNELQAAGSNSQELFESVTNGPLLTPGTYWLGLDTPVNVNGVTSSTVTWSANGQGVDGADATFGEGVWTAGSREQGAFEVDGVIVAPEPVTTVLFASGFAGLVWFRRRKST